jgi:serine/threonine protein phosphatase 1
MRWVIGDIHGMYGALDALVNAIGRRDHAARFYFVGDYVNRGPDSRRVLEYLVHLQNARFVRGNHDDVLDLILNGAWEGGEADTFEPAAACGWFLQHGLEDTLESYGIDLDVIERLHMQESPDLLKLIRAAVPEMHRLFIRSLPVVIQEEGLFVAHAFWPPEETNDRAHVNERLVDDAEMVHRVIWERWKIPQIIAAKPWSRPAFFGHTPVTNYPGSMREGANRPVFGPMVTLLDTAIALGASGRLSAVCVEDGQLIQIDRTFKEVPAT